MNEDIFLKKIVGTVKDKINIRTLEFDKNLNIEYPKGWFLFIFNWTFQGRPHDTKKSDINLLTPCVERFGEERGVNVKWHATPLGHQSVFRHPLNCLRPGRKREKKKEGFLADRFTLTGVINDRLVSRWNPTFWHNLTIWQDTERALAATWHTANMRFNMIDPIVVIMSRVTLIWFRWLWLSVSLRGDIYWYHTYTYSIGNPFHALSRRRLELWAPWPHLVLD